MSDTNYVRLDDGNDPIRHSGAWRPSAMDKTEKLKSNYYQFLQNLYWYYEQGGFINVFVSLLMKVLSAIFTLCFIFILSTMVQWKAAWENKLDPAKDTLLIKPSRNASIAWASSVAVLTLICFVWSSFYVVLAWRVRHYCKTVLNLSDDEISTMPWDVFIKHVATFDKFILPKNNATWEDLVVILNRKSNYLVALYNQRLMNVSVPCFPSWKSVTTVFDWSFAFATRDLWTETGEVNPSYLHGNHSQNVARLRRSFITTGLLSLILSPFVLVSMLAYVFFTFLEEVRNSPGIIFSRTWSTLARWRFRNFNEVPCALNDRLASAYPHARAYVHQFKNPVSTTIARFGVYVLAVLAAPLVIFSLLAEHILVLNLWGGPGARTVLFVATLIAASLATVRAMIPGDDFVFVPHKHMEKVLKHVKLPPTKGIDWVMDAHTPEVRNRFSAYFKSKGLIFLSEIAAVVTGPFIFMVSMSNASEQILSFLKDNTIQLGGGMGSAIKFTRLDISDVPDVPEPVPAHQAQISLSLSDTVLKKAGRTDKDELLKAKIHDSVLGFAGYYPHWKPQASDSATLLGKSEIVQYGSTMYRPDPSSIDAQIPGRWVAGRRMVRSGPTASTQKPSSSSTSDATSVKMPTDSSPSSSATSDTPSNSVEMNEFVQLSAAFDKRKSKPTRADDNV